MNSSDSNAVSPPSENAVNRIVEIFDVENFDGFLELVSQVGEPEELLDYIDEPEEIELFADSFDEPDFTNFVLNLLEIDGTEVSAEETGSITDTPGTISGTKWNDINGDGIKDPDEPGLAGWTIYLDENQNGLLDEGETFIITDTDGNYTFEDLKTPDTYVVAEVVKSSDLPTFPLKEDALPVDESDVGDRTTAYTGTPNDPLFADRWHLSNTGQTGGYPGVDANVLPAWQKAVGEDVVVGIVDDSLQSDHPDLADKYRSELSYDFIEDDSDPTPDLNAEFPPSHGTAVAGVAAASTNNETGVAGVAPNADLAGLRLLPNEDDEALVIEEEFVSDLGVAQALSYRNQEIDIYNNSWGDLPFKGLGEETQTALQNGVRNGRGGLGNIFIFSAANGRVLQDNVNYNSYANSRYTIAVAAIDHTNNLTFYSTPGAAVFVSGHSGDLFGADITTTDLTGEDGYNPDGDYTDSFNGTSSAAPLVSGVVALMLDANPELTWRDVQHILVETSAQNDPSDLSWTVNGAGHEVSYKYGFGAVDANAAVIAARDWMTVEEEVVTSSERVNVDTAIPDNDGSSISSTIEITENIDVEWVEIVFDAEHTKRGDLEVKVTSPDGTESILAETHRDENNDYNSWVFTSARHWDEASAGDWTLEVADNSTRETGTWNSWQLNVYGTYADANNIAGAQQVTVNSGENVDNINFGAQQVTSNDVVDRRDRFALESESTSTISNFNPQEDLSELPRNIGFDSLEITQGEGENAANTEIVLAEAESNTIAILYDTDAEEITQSVFV